jgi:DNA-binding transcriptional ArsR family regulator
MPEALQDTFEITEPRAMRALAHPARLAILELLQVDGTANATECAREIGGSPQAASYHLRALAKWGLIRRVDSPDGRETRWALVARSLSFVTHGDDSPAFRDAVRLLGRRVLDRDERHVAEFLAAEHEFDREWRASATFSSGSVYVSAAELRRLTREFKELVERYRRPDPADRPKDSRRVHVVFRAVPRVDRKPSKRRR